MLDHLILFHGLLMLFFGRGEMVFFSLFASLCFILNSLYSYVLGSLIFSSNLYDLFLVTSSVFFNFKYCFFSSHELPFGSFLYLPFSLFIILMFFTTSWVHAAHCNIYHGCFKDCVISLLLSHVSLFLLIDFSVDYGTNIFWILACWKVFIGCWILWFFSSSDPGFVFYLKSVGFYSDVWLSYLKPA